MTPTCPWPPHPPSLHLINPNSKTQTKLPHILRNQLSMKEMSPSEKEQAAHLCFQGWACVIPGRPRQPFPGALGSPPWGPPSPAWSSFGTSEWVLAPSGGGSPPPQQVAVGAEFGRGRAGLGWGLALRPRNFQREGPQRLLAEGLQRPLLTF